MMCLSECLAATCICQSCVGRNRMAARYVYGIFFLLTNILAWMARDYSHKGFIPFHYLKACRGGKDCLGADGVLRLSFGSFMFSLLMFLTTVGTSSTGNIRDAWHAGWWPVKTILWITLIAVPFLIPTQYIEIYGGVARYGAGIFLVIQLVSVINFIYFWNEDWLTEKNERRCRIPMVLMSALSFIASLSIVVVMFMWFAPHKNCKLNIFFISFTLVLIVSMTAVSVNSKVNAGLLTSGLMAIYTVYLCWSAITSEPLSANCNSRPRLQTGSNTDWLTILEFVIGFCAIVLATFTTGIDSKSFAIPRKDGSGTDNKAPYSYGYFHFVFATGAMYFAMLFIGWNPHQTMHKWSIDVGWTSVWVKIVNEWLAVGLYGEYSKCNPRKPCNKSQGNKKSWMKPHPSFLSIKVCSA